MLGNVTITVSHYTVSNLHFIFILSAILQALTIFFILKVKEPAASTPVAVIMQLRNDLNPQTGIAGAADFMMVELQKTEGILNKIDKLTDKMADKSEEQIGKVLDKGEKIVKKPWNKIKDFFKED
jgi:hypothetical protein